MVFYPFSYRRPVASKILPLTLISLEDWVIITVLGEDSAKYLQSQVTLDINKITENLHLPAAHCNPKGKVLSNLSLFRFNNGFAFIERRSLIKTQLVELKKYSVFSKVTIDVDDNYMLLGVAGFKARSALKKIFNFLPNADESLTRVDGTFLLWFKNPIERFLIITDTSTAKSIVKILSGEAQLNNSQQWLSLNIEAGDPIIDAANSGQFIPQEINLQILGGISFKKGCYIGQETVARVKFRGMNKRALWYLSGYANRVPKIGEALEMKIDTHWRSIGSILAAVQLADGRLLVQIVMNNNVGINSVFRVRDDVNIMSIQSLPYHLNT